MKQFIAKQKSFVRKRQLEVRIHWKKILLSGLEFYYLLCLISQLKFDFNSGKDKEDCGWLNLIGIATKPYDAMCSIREKLRDAKLDENLIQNIPFHY